VVSSGSGVTGQISAQLEISTQLASKLSLAIKGYNSLVGIQHYYKKEENFWQAYISYYHANLLE